MPAMPDRMTDAYYPIDHPHKQTKTPVIHKPQSYELAFDFVDIRISLAIGEHMLGIAHPLMTIDTEANYERFVAGLMDRNLSEEDRLILRVTRMLGECDLTAPPEYIREVHTYIRRWQSTSRFVRAARLGLLLL